MVTERRMVANKSNALKSTGPTTAEGKANARRNALKHGMTCEKENLFSSDAILFKDRLGRWTKTFHPRNDVELYQIECAVRATVNLDRCARNANAEMDKRTRQAVGHWEGVQTKKINQATKHWTTQPANCVAQLEKFARGVEWLLARWEELAQALEANKCWTRNEAWYAIRLMGKCPETFDGDGEVAAFRNLVIAAWPEIKPGAIDALLHIETASLEPEAQDSVLNQKLPTREEALEGLWATLNAELERLIPLRERLWEREDGPARSQKMDLAAFDDSKNGVLRRRYESANHMDLHRCLKQFTEQRRQTELRSDDPIEIEERAAEAEEAELLQAVEKFEKEKAQAQAARLRNEPKSPATTESHVVTSGDSADVYTSPYSDPSKYIKKVSELRPASSEVRPTSNRADSGAGEAPKPS
jgi:hypothetical protein